MLGSSPAEATPEAICARRGCRQAAVVRLLWNNPRIHTPERRKVWLACPEHAPWLSAYLSERELLRSTEEMAP
nr:acetone carboxylase [Falsarthrobacter nasiphocae]